MYPMEAATQEIKHSQHLMLVFKFRIQVCSGGIIYVIKLITLLVIAEEDLDGQPGVAANLEALGQRVNNLDLVVSQLPAIKLEVSLDALLRDRLGYDAGATLQTPNKENLLDSLALFLGELLELLVLVER